MQPDSGEGAPRTQTGSGEEPGKRGCSTPMPRGNLRQSRALTLRLILEAASGLASWGRFFLDLPPTVIRPRPNINPWRDINSGGYVSTRSYVAATGNATAPSVGNASDGILTTHPYGYK